MSTYNPEQYIVRHSDGSPLPKGAKFFVCRYDINAPWGKAARACMFTFAAHLRGEFATKIYKAITEVEVNEETTDSN